MQIASSKKDKLTYKHKLGLLFTSLSVLMLEFTLIRVLSVSLWYHFAFMIISIALLGIGISGVTILVSDKISKVGTNKFLTLISIAYSFSVIVCFAIMNSIPFDPFSLIADSNQWLYLPIYYLLITIPFFLSGLIIGLMFTRFKNDISKLYFFDLVGAGLSCFVFIIVLPMFGGSGGIIAASLIASIAAVFFSIEKSKLSSIGIFASFIIIVLNIFFLTEPDSFLPISVSSNKVYGNYIKENPELRILTKWNSFSRVDVMEDDEPPIDEYPVYTAIIDAGNSTTNIPFVPQVKDSLSPPADASNLAMILKRDTANVFIVGSGGGGEIVSALSYNAKSVTAVEINPILNDLIENDFANFWTTGIARSKKVKIITDDARSFLRGKRIKYDVLISAHTITGSASSSGAMSLVENYIMTKEAVMDYLRHLKVDGILYISRPETQVPRLVTTIKLAHKEIGGIDFKNQFYIFKRPPSNFERDVSYLTGVVYKKDGFSEFDIQLLKTQSALLNLETIYDPVSKQAGIYRELIQSDNINETIKDYPFNLSPATDDNPYFEHQTSFFDLKLSNFKEAFSQDERAIITIIQKPVAEATLVVLLGVSALIAVLLIFLPIRIKYKNKPVKSGALPGVKKNRKGRYILYFASLGLGYIMIEICLIQKFTLFLGQPVYTMLTVISTLLIFSGIGSMSSGKVFKLFRNNVWLIFLLIAVITILIGLFNPMIFEMFVRADIIWRVMVSIVLIAPLGFLMGMPFPYGISRISDSSRYLVAYAWGVNGFFSVIGSVLVVMMTMTFGFRVVFIVSGLIYLMAVMPLRKMEAAEA